MHQRFTRLHRGLLQQLQPLLRVNKYRNFLSVVLIVSLSCEQQRSTNYVTITSHNDLLIVLQAALAALQNSAFHTDLSYPRCLLPFLYLAAAGKYGPLHSKVYTTRQSHIPSRFHLPAVAPRFLPDAPNSSAMRFVCRCMCRKAIARKTGHHQTSQGPSKRLSKLW